MHSVLLSFFVASVSFLSWLHWDDVFFRLMNDNGIRHHHLRSHLAFWIVRQHNCHFDTKHSLTHSHVTNCGVDVVLLWLTSGDKVPIFELHCLCTLRSHFSADHHFAPLGAILHNETDNAVAS